MSNWTVKARGGALAPPDLEEVRRALAIFADPAAGVMLQALPSGKFHTLPAADIDALVNAVNDLADGTGVYWTLNPLSPQHKGSVHVGDVVRRRWLLVDVDRRKKEADKNLCATSAEHDLCWSKARRVKDWLAEEHGWPQPVEVDPGNGWHLLYRIDLPNDDLSRLLVKTVLATLKLRFDDEHAEIDGKVWNANRVSRLPGCWNRKGIATADRPHRMAKLVQVPDCLQVVTAEQLQIGEPVGRLAGTSTDTPFPPPKVHSPYGQTALNQEAGEVLRASPGKRNEQLNESAFSLGQLVAGGELLRDEVEIALHRAAGAAGLLDDPGCGEAGVQATIKSGIEAGILSPRSAPQKVNGAVHTAHASPNLPKSATVYRMTDLLGMTFPPPNWAVPGLLSEGLTILAGKPKLGKSWMALNLGLTLAAGGKALGSAEVQAGDVLYLSLEDRLRRVQDRARKVLSGLGCEASARLHVAVEWRRQDAGGLDDLHDWLDEAERPVLVIVDVWTRFRPIGKIGRSAYEQDYDHLIALKAVIDAHRTNGLLVHHCKKARADDVLDEVSGTLGQAGATDGTLVLTRARNENEAELFVTGRDVEEKQLALEFDPARFTWTVTGNPAERSESKYKNALLAIFKANVGFILGPCELADRLGFHTDQQKGAIRVTLGRMAEQGVIERVGPGRFRYPIVRSDEA